MIDDHQRNSKPFHLFQDWFSNLSERWKQQWEYCHPCLESMEPDSILYMDQMDADKQFLFNKIGLEYNFDMTKLAPGPNDEHADEEKVKKKYGKKTHWTGN